MHNHDQHVTVSQKTAFWKFIGFAQHLYACKYVYIYSTFVNKECKHFFLKKFMEL